MEKGQGESQRNGQLKNVRFCCCANKTKQNLCFEIKQNLAPLAVTLKTESRVQGKAGFSAARLSSCYWLLCLPAVWPWTRYLLSQSLSFLCRSSELAVLEKARLKVPSTPRGSC